MPPKTTKKRVTRRRKKTATVGVVAESIGPVDAVTENRDTAEVKQVDVRLIGDPASDAGVAPPEASEQPVQTKKKSPSRSRRKKTIKKVASGANAAVESDVKEVAPPKVQSPAEREPSGDPPIQRDSGDVSDKTTETPALSDKHEDGDRKVARSRGRSRSRRDSRRRTENRNHPPSSIEQDSAQAETQSDVTAPAPAEDVAAKKSPPKRPSGKRQRGGAGRGKLERSSGRGSGAAKPTRREPTSSDPDLDIADEASTVVPAPSKTMLINVSAGDECRIALVHKGRLEELFIERASSQSHVGNIYKGRVMNVEPSIQAAFVDFGLGKNGFLHISDIQPQYFPDFDGEPEDVGRKIPRRDRPPIQDCFRRGQEVIVQVIKEGVGTKGPTLTSYLSIPGRFLVMMPGMSRHGVSRKVEDEELRRSMRDLLNEMKLPTGMGFILRTAGVGQSKRELQRDLTYLQRLWKTVVDRVKKMDAPAGLYQESDLVTRTIRDFYTTDFERVIVDDADAAKKAREFLRIAMPRTKAHVELYSEREPLFHRFGIEEEIENISKRQVPLRSGGSLVIDSTEALVAIDVNSGRFRGPDDSEEMAFQLNIEAAEEIARQLRLRDLGGLIVCDFIDMRMDRHKRGVERALRDALKKHKERARILRLSAFGLIEMTRQRRGPSMKRNTFFECQHCMGTGLVKMPESVVLEVLRVVQLASHQKEIQAIHVTSSNDVAFQILNRKRALLHDIEATTGKAVIIRGDDGFTADQTEVIGEDARGRRVAFGPSR